MTRPRVLAAAKSARCRTFLRGFASENGLYTLALVATVAFFELVLLVDLDSEFERSGVIRALRLMELYRERVTSTHQFCRIYRVD